MSLILINGRNFRLNVDMCSLSDDVLKDILIMPRLKQLSFKRENFLMKGEKRNFWKILKSGVPDFFVVRRSSFELTKFKIFFGKFTNSHKPKTTLDSNLHKFAMHLL